MDKGTRLEPRQIDTGPGRTVSAVVAYPAPFRRREAAAVFLAHGAGSDMRNPFLSAVHEALAQHGYLAVKFNFPYKERGGRAPDPAPVLEATYRGVADAIRGDPDLLPRKIVLGGKSLGGRMASQLAAAGYPCSGLLFLGYPLHPPGRKDKPRIAHLRQIRVPMLFLAGTRDPLCDLTLLRQTIADLNAPVTLHVVDGGDHSFHVLKRSGRTDDEAQEEIISASLSWLDALEGGQFASE